jgi:hypothetical protein
LVGHYPTTNMVVAPFRPCHPAYQGLEFLISLKKFTTISFQFPFPNT